MSAPPVLQQGDGPQWEPRPPKLFTGIEAYQSVAGKPAAALRGASPTLLDFIDDRIRGLDAERHALCMLKEQLAQAGVSLSVDDLRRLLG